MTLFSGGEIEAIESDAIKGGDPEKKLTFVMVMALVRHPHGDVLIDAGFGTRHAEHVRSFPANVFQLVMKPRFDPKKDSAVAHLDALGVTSDDVDYLLPTHMHWDHIGGLGDFPKARLVVPRAEWEAAHQGDLTLAVRGYADSMYEDLRPEAMLIEWPDAPFGTFERSIDLFGDGSVMLLDANGHTRGSMAILVSLPSGERFLFTGDASWLRRGYREHKHKGWKTRLLDNSRRGVMPTLARIAQLEHLARDVKVVPAHDPEVWAELKHAPIWYGGDEVAEAVKAVLAAKPIAELVSMDPLARADFVYEAIYGNDSPKPEHSRKQVHHEEMLAEYERTMIADEWHVRAGLAGASDGGDQRRIYLNLLPHYAAGLANGLCKALDDAQVPFTLKLPLKLEGYTRSSAGVLYVPAASYARAKEVVLSVTKEAPLTLGDKTPAFAKRLAPGVAAAHEPHSGDALPPLRPRHSFGTVRSDAIAEAFEGMSEASPPEQIIRAARARLTHYGVDADRPWLNPGAPDDL